MSPYHKIICLTEEAAEILCLLGLEHLIAGVSVYAVRPKEIQQKPKVSHFISANIDKIDQIGPDLIIGFSDLQQDIAKLLIAKGYNVWISNHRSLNGIFNYIQALANLVGAADKGKNLIHNLQLKIHQTQEQVKHFSVRPKVYFEEWDGPYFTAIEWVSEIVELCGGDNIFGPKAKGILAKDRQVEDEEVILANPDIIFCCWCGKKVHTQALKNRPGWSAIKAVQSDKIIELPPEIMLQPGPAPILEGIDMILTQIRSFQS